MLLINRRSLGGSVLIPWADADQIFLLAGGAYASIFLAGVDMECHFLGLGQPVPGGLKQTSVCVLKGKKATEKKLEN